MSGEYYLDQIKRCVTFVFDPADEPLGTGFFVSIELEDQGYAVYLVTAKHVLQDGSAKYYDYIFIRSNLIGGTSERIGLPLTYAPDYVLTHDDENVDLAAYLLNPPADRYGYQFIPQDYFTDSDILQKKNIREGSNVFFAGLFSRFARMDRNYPVVRFGKIALMTNEKIEVNKRGEPIKLAHLYVIECQSIGAFSGSPVFFEVERITQEKLFRTPEIYLGGIIKGHYDNIVESPVGYREFNAGLALVTPCYLLNELLNTKKAKEQREELLHKIRSQERERDNESI